MARIKRGITSHKRHKKLLALAKGYQGGRSKLIKQAKEAVWHAGNYAFAGRKLRRRNMRRLWITQLGIFLRNQGTGYNEFIKNLKASQIEIDRKILAELAVKHPKTLEQIITQVTPKV